MIFGKKERQRITVQSRRLEAALEKITGDWISVKDGVPADGELVLIIKGENVRGAYIWRNPAGWFSNLLNTPYTELGITMWQRIPDVPQGSI